MRNRKATEEGIVCAQSFSKLCNRKDAEPQLLHFSFVSCAVQVVSSHFSGFEGPSVAITVGSFEETLTVEKQVFYG